MRGGLAVCAILELCPNRVPEAVGATHLAAAANRGLSTLIETKGRARGNHAHDAFKDVREARWKARLATR